MDSIMQDVVKNIPVDDDAPTTGPSDEVAALIAEIKAAAAEDGVSMSQVAKAVDIAYGTWSNFVGGTYAGRTERLVNAGRAWLSARKAKKRTQSILPRAPLFVPTDGATKMIATLEHAQHAPDFVVIGGAPGVGKTVSIHQYQRMAPSVWVVTGEPTLRSAWMLLDYIAEAMGLTGSRSSQKQSRALVRRLQGSGGLIVVDEAQHLCTAALDQLRTLHDLAGVGIAVVGNETVYNRIQGNARTAEFAQLHSRVGMRINRPKPSKADIDALIDAWKVEGERERKLLGIIARKPGALRIMTKVLLLAHRTAAAEGGTLQAAHIEAAYSRLAAEQISTGGEA
jgi:DNA transposition AAA+ family ATPase